MRTASESRPGSPGIRVTLLSNSEEEHEGVQRAEIHVPGWEAHRCEVRVATIDGEPRVVGVLLAPRWNDAPEDSRISDLIMTRARFAAFPMARIAQAVASVALGDFRAAREPLAAVASGQPEDGDPRRLTTPERVAEVYMSARAKGLPPRAEVSTQLRISNRTADRYIAAARKQGLLPAYSTERKKRL